ncbi:uncharacterized protein, partial [Littorina saxatilis]|uniref:uncharacterized protein n=1 Tax=Littorina saxatilis TaxID=31220 RepID=UPI0038B62EFC
MTMAAKVIFLVALVALVSSQQTDDAFSRIDVNGDGSLSATELEAFCDLLDRNNDGSVNYREFTSFNDTLAATNEYKAQFAYYDNISGVMDDKLVCQDDAFTFFGKMDVN